MLREYTYRGYTLMEGLDGGVDITQHGELIDHTSGTFAAYALIDEWHEAR